MAPLLNIHSIIPSSTVNGPGERMVVFFQGCKKGCPGCFNPATHSQAEKELLTWQDIFKNISLAGIEGITVSGGEPFLQPDGLALLLKMSKELYNLSTLVYTGFDYEELRAREEMNTILSFIDVLVDGGYEASRKETTTLARGSTNQSFHFLTDRYDMDDFIMPGKVEIIIGADGRITGTGFDQITAMP